MVGVDGATYMLQASEETGLDDFGPSSFRDGLDHYADAVAGEARLNEVGAVAVPAAITAALATRLRVIDWAKHHPELGHERIDAPVVVIGLFRAGTTLLSNLLDQDPNNRALLRWESGDPVPPPTPADSRHGPRVDAARMANDLLEQLNPAVRAIHHEEADGPTECIAVMSQDFKSLSWEAITNVPTYGAWLRDADHLSAYDYHGLVLQILQSGGVRGRWTLKSPHHALALDALVATYPDARLVLLHRDPLVLSASVCSLVSTLSGTFTDADHTRYIAEHWTSMLEESVRRIDLFRLAHPEHPVIDVQYADLANDPLGTVGTLYDRLDIDLDGVAHAAIASYAADHPKGTHGAHGYDLARYGLNPGDLRERFAGYVQRYRVPSET